MRRQAASSTISAIATATLIACAGEPAAPPLAPVIDAASVAPNPQNVLSAIVTVTARHADSITVRFHLADVLDVSDSVTPAAVATEMNSLPVLGLLPARHYVLHAIAYGQGGTASSGPLDLVTAALPSDLPSYTATGTDPSPGYVVMAAGMYGLVIDNTGRVVWYHRFANGPWLNFMAQPNARYVARLVTPDLSDIESWVEIDPLGNVTRTFGCALGLQPRFHDLISEPNGGYWILCDETRTMDLSQDGGFASAKVTGTAIQHVSSAGELLFHWSPFDHFLITDADPQVRASQNVNWTHGNSLDLDASGNLLVSFRNLNEITRIDSHTGAVLWRLGGRRNEFIFANGSKSFAGQHSVRVLGQNQFLIMDNIGDATESRAERWTLDAASGLAWMLDSHGSVPAVRTLIGGSVQALPGNRTMVSFGTEGRVEEYDAQGVVRWRIDGAPGYVFRAQRIGSLYRPGVDGAR